MANLWRIEVQNGNDELSFESRDVTIGGRLGVDVVLRDVMVADRHCVIGYEDGFVLRDTGSVTGTWVDGQRAAPAATLQDGGEVVIGTTRVTVSIDDDDGAPVLKLEAAAQSFWWKRPGKGAFDNDADRLALSEARFGRFGALKFSNRLATIAGAAVLIGATFVTSVMEPLADPGPLMPPHALVTTAALDAPDIEGAFQEQCVALAQAQGCNVCHTTGAGAPEQKCAQCHGLEGEMGHQDSWRHPYLRDGLVQDQQHCVLCHTDHNGGTDRKPASDLMVGKCESCHDESRGALLETVPVPTLQQPLTAFQDLDFSHEQHVGEQIDCGVCHQIDPEVQERFQQGLPLANSRHDYAEVSYKVCASCHVDGAEPVNMTGDEQADWRARAEDQQWTVAWHGTDDGGGKCLQCHTQQRRRDADVIGPEMKTTPRGTWTDEQYRAERAMYVNQTRSHAAQFEQHAKGKKCTECHLDGSVETAAQDERPPRPFWHGLHMARGALAPVNAAEQVKWSADAEQGCVSCHGDLAGTAELTPFRAAVPASSYHWPQGEQAQAACKECHNEGEGQGARLLALLAVPPASTAASQEDRFQFPHDVHLGSAAYGKDGSLEAGCFACHEFSEPGADGGFTQVPRTFDDAKDCSKCHGNEHRNIGGGDCQECHPRLEGRSNSFLWQAKVDAPVSERPWPTANDFEHLSPGHKDERCDACHQAGVNGATTLGQLRVPDESAGLCRDCHIQKQYHWR